MNELFTGMDLQHILAMMDFLGWIDFSHLFQYNDAAQSIAAGLKKVASALKTIGLVVGGIYIALAGYQFMWGGANGSQQGKQYLLNAAIGIVLIYGGGEIAQWVADNMTF